MKIIDIYNKVANGEKVPCFKINGEKYILGVLDELQRDS